MIKTTVTRELNYTPQKHLVSFHESGERVRVLAMGRQHGKTYAIAGEVAKQAVSRPGIRIRIVGPIMDQGQQCFKYLLAIIPEDAIEHQREHPYPEIRLYNGTLIEVRSGKQADNLRSAPIDVLVIEEAAMWPNGDFWNALTPAVDDNGYILVSSTPKGRNWFYYDLWKKTETGQQQDDNYRGWHYSSLSEYFTQERYDREKKEKSERAFAQEIDAKFLDDADAVFKSEHVRNMFIAGEVGTRMIDPEKKLEYLHCRIDKKIKELPTHYIGVDVGQAKDYTIITALERPRPDYKEKKVRQCYLERFVHDSYPIIIERISKVMEAMPGTVRIDATGVGKPVYDELRIRYPGRISAFIFTEKSKDDLIESLKVTIEKGRLEIPECEITKVQMNELLDIQYYRRRNGTLTCSAPEGQHDDTVMALGMAVLESRKAVRVEVF